MATHSSVLAWRIPPALSPGSDTSVLAMISTKTHTGPTTQERVRGQGQNRARVPPSAPGSLIPGILQARTLEWVAIAFSNA